MISQKKLRGFFVSLALMVAILVFAGGCISTGNTTDGSANTDAGIRLITEEFPPFNYAGADGKPAGQAVDVVNGILYRLNQKADPILPWNEGYTAAVD